MRTPSISVFTIFIVLIFVLFIRSSKIIPSFFTIKKGFFLPLRLSCKESSTFSPSPSSSGSGDVTALLGARDRYALRLADHQRSAPDCARWDRLRNITTYKRNMLENLLSYSCDKFKNALLSFYIPLQPSYKSFTYFFTNIK